MSNNSRSFGGKPNIKHQNPQVATPDVPVVPAQDYLVATVEPTAVPTVADQDPADTVAPVDSIDVPVTPSQDPELPVTVVTESSGLIFTPANAAAEAAVTGILDNAGDGTEGTEDPLVTEDDDTGEGINEPEPEEWVKVLRGQIDYHVNQFIQKAPPVIKVSGPDLAEAQRIMAGVFNFVLSRPSNEFFTAYDYLLSLFEKHKDGALSDINAMRGVETFTTSTKTVTQSKHLLRLSVSIADRTTRREALKQSVSTKAVLDTILTEQGKDNLNAFIGYYTR